MCGITGFFRQHPSKSNQDIIIRMTNTLSHRGPDAFGYANLGACSLGHRRLSIIDLSTSANQPFFSKNRRYSLVYNGEIYNYKLIKKELESKGISFQTSSDTEVLLKGFIFYGEKILHKLNGCFAFAIYDQQKEELFLARDRIGIKPLYYYFESGYFVFGSELKAIRAYPFFKPIMNKKGIQNYFTFGFIPAPLTIYKHVFKLNPGHYITINKNHFSTTAYWALNDFIHSSNKNSTSENQQITEELLMSSVQQRLVADVPVGSFLSGGIDSTLISYYMRTLGMAKAHSFHIGFSESAFDESYYAKLAAEKVGSVHHSHIVNGQQAIEVMGQLPEIYDEPFADSSGIVTTLLSQRASKEIKVALSGDGGDELFWGYNRYFHQEKIYKYWHAIPKILRPLISKILPYLPFGKVQRLYKFIEDYQRTNDIRTLYLRSITYFDKAKLAELLHISTEAITYEMKKTLSLLNKVNPPVAIIAFMDLQYYLPDDILTKVDRASMSTGLEVRTPFLDHRLIEHAVNIPFEQKTRERSGKIILKDLLKKDFDSNFLDRKKQGFGVPLKKWLKNEMRIYINEYLNPTFIKKQEIFDPKIIQDQVNIFFNAKRDYSAQIWTILMFQLWWNKWMK